MNQPSLHKVLVLLRFFILSLMLGPLGLGCHKKETETEKSSLNVSFGPAPSTLDWHLYKEAQSGLLLINLMRGLYQYDLNSKTLRVVPDLVKSSSHNNRFDLWKFCLKAGLKWSDGKLLTPQHFMDSWQRVLDPKTGSPHSHHLSNIEGAMDFNQGKVPFSKVGIKKNGNSCLTVKLSEPTADFPTQLTAPYTFPIRKDLIEKNTTEWSSPQNLITLGPYVLSSGELRESLTLHPHPHYEKKSFKHQKIIFHWLENKATALSLFRQGKLDLVKSPDYQQVIKLGLSKNYISGPAAGISYIGFNLKKASLKNKKLRARIAQVIGNSKLQMILGKDADQSLHLVPWELLGHNSSPLKFSDSSKHQNLPQIKHLSLHTNVTPLNQKISEHLAFQIQENLGIKVQVKLEENTSYFGSLGENFNGDLFRISYTPASLKPISFLNHFHSSSPMNFTGYKNEAFDQLLLKARQQTDLKKKVKLIKELEKKVLREDVVAVPLYRHRQSFLLNSKKLWLKPHFSEQVRFYDRD